MRSNTGKKSKDAGRKSASKSPIPGVTEQFDFEDLLREFKPAQLLKNSKSGPSLHQHRNETEQNFLENSFNQEKGTGPPKGIKLQHIEQFFKSCFPKNFTNRDVTFLMSGKHELQPEQLYELLCINNVADFDPVEQAFRMLDVEGKGYITLDAFQQTFCKLNDCKLTLLQTEILKDITDIDKDGKINLNDFRCILDELERAKQEEDKIAEEEKLKQAQLFMLK